MTKGLTPVLVDGPALRERVRSKVTGALEAAFPLDLKGRTLEIKDVAVHAKDFSPEDQKRALLTGDSLHEPVKATLVLRGADGKVVDEAKNFTLVHLPYFTERHTLIADGNEYQVANQLRRKPGAYTQRAENGRLHTAFNLGKGANFDVTLHPEEGTLHLQYQTTSIPLYPVLRALGVPHQDIAAHLGGGVANLNKAVFDRKQETAVAKLYQRLSHPATFNAAAPHETKVEEIKKRYATTELDPDVTHHTLGEKFERVTPQALLAASKKLLAVHNGKAEVDDSDSLAYKTFHSVDDFLAERVKLTARDWSKKAKFALAGKDSIRDALRPAPFSASVRKFVTTSQLTAVPTGINPIELLDHSVKVTSLGEGGIGSERAIPEDARMTHPTHFGVLDPIRTPESGHAGVDVRAAMAAHRDDKGNLYTPVYDVKARKQIFLRAGEMLDHVVAFPHQELEGLVDAFVRGEVRKVPARQVTHQFLHSAHALSPATALIPMLHNIQGNRAIMGSKMQTQGLPLVEREAPLVQVRSHLQSYGERSYEDLFGRMFVPTSPVNGVVEKIEGGYIHVRPHGKVASDASNVVKVPYQHNFPFPSKTYLHHDLHVKPGDEVKADQRLGDSNFTRDGVLALGKNLLVAYMPYHGLNSNDAVVISEGCAKKLTSEHMYREVFPLSAAIELGRDKHKVYFGPRYTPEQYAKLDADGVVRKGARVNPKDLLIAGVVKQEVQGADAILGRLAKSLARPYREVALAWSHGVPGEVVDVVRTAGQVAILIRTREQMQVGDKLAGRYGNKGVVAKIVPDAEMVRDEAGRPIDLVLTSAGVVSRINPAQIIETAVAKVADKTGKPIVYDNAERRDAVQWAKDLLKEHGVKDKEVVYDPLNKRTIAGPDGKGVLVGKQYTFKLFKSTDTNFAGHGVGPYDINEQPLKTGGDESAKGIGKMEFDALLAHNARGVLHEAATIRSQKNDEYWRAAQLGLPLPAPKPSFAFTKFTTMLEGAGVKVDKRGAKLKLLPLTDRDVLARSAGEIKNNKTIVAKNLRPEAGGLFDPALTGGPQGGLYSHIALHEPVPHPVFEEPVRRLLGMTEKEFQAKLAERGGGWFRNELAKLDVEKRLGELRKRMAVASGAELNDVVKQIKYLEALRREGLRPHEAYVITKVPVVPPVFRPIVPQKNDPSQLMVSDANKLYAHLMDANHVAKNTVLESDRPKHRGALYNAVGALFGTHDVENDELKGQQVKGFIAAIAGVGSPKSGFFQRKLMARTMDVSGRGTAVPDGNLHMDEVGMPEDMLWQMFDKLLVARLVRTGYPALEARELVDKRAPAARDALLAETRERPVIINRAPTLHRFSIIAAYARPVQGKTIRVNPFVEKGMNLDYDGDTLQVHAPVTTAGIGDARRMTMSQLLLGDQQRHKLMAFPQHEAIIGVAHAASAKGTGQVRHYKTRDEAVAAWRRGELAVTDQVEVETEKTAAAEDEAAPAGGWTEELALALYPAASVTGWQDERGGTPSDS